MKPRRASWLAARREIRERLRSRAFRISTLVQVLAVIAVAVIASLTGGDGTTEVKVGTIDQVGRQVVRVADETATRADVKIESEPVSSPAEARGRIGDEDLDFAVGEGTLLAADGAPEAAEAILSQASSAVALRHGMERAGISPADSAELLASSDVPVETVAGKSDDSGNGIAFITTLLLYLALIFCGYAVAGGVVEEKATRVVELIINAIKPRQLLAGKVVGIGLMGLGQLVLIVGAGLGTSLLIGSIDLPSATFQTALLALLYFGLGFALYGCAFAVAGSIVSRQEDSSTTTAPVMMVLVAAYIVSISATNDPESTLATVCTLLPPTAPLIVPARAAAGYLPPEQLIASVLLMLACCGLLIWVAGRVYERTVLRMGAPVKLRELIRIFRTG
ncbi:MAG: ABC transporter permease [Solirubrobacterales bacterium]|nr:ABC transporter permease [Solirubrobacterales bacterium]